MGGGKGYLELGKAEQGKKGERQFMDVCGQGGSVVTRDHPVVNRKGEGDLGRGGGERRPGKRALVRVMGISG